MRRHVSNRTVEPDRVVVMDVLCYCLTSIINAGQALGPYAIPFDRPMISLDLSCQAEGFELAFDCLEAALFWFSVKWISV